MSLSKLQIMGVINLTPDSFSDGGSFNSTDSFKSQYLKLAADGADFIDIGAESTRPGAIAIDLDTEWQRLLPALRVLQTLHTNQSLAISLDTRNAETAISALGQCPITMINSMAGVFSQSALKELLKLGKKHGLSLKYCAGHMHGEPQTMQSAPLRSELVESIVENFFASSYEELRSAGFLEEDIYLDPGIGFGKNDPANFCLLAKTGEWSKKYNLLLGVSRKGMIGRMLGIDNPVLRDPGSKMLEASLAMMGAKVIRTHDVKGLSVIKSLAMEKI